MADVKVDVENSAYGSLITRLCGQLDFKAVVTVVNAAASQTDTITVNGVAISFVSDATPTKKKIATGLADAVNASVDPLVKGKVVASVNATDDFVLKSLIDVLPTCTGSANLAVTSTTADLPVNPNADASPASAVFLAFQPEATTTGTLTLKDGGRTKLVIPIGVTVAAPYKVDGLKFPNGLTVTPSVIGDRGAIIWKQA
jgi:hypothetical protein